MLGGLLDVRHVLIPLVLHHLVHHAEFLLLLADLLVFLLQIVLFELLHGHLIARLSAEAVGHGGVPGQLLSVRSQGLEVRRPLLLLSLEILELLLHVLHRHADAIVLFLLLLLQRFLLQVGADEEIDLRLDIVEELLLPSDILVLRLHLLGDVLLGCLQRTQRLLNALLAHLRLLVLALQPLELLGQLRVLGQGKSGLGVQLIELLVQGHTFHHQLGVDVFLPV
mmetsp:Transcript_110896/g.247605  ORF Transcript_110896/g.247605 Transcript_110896/m.247605 type:complete len:224 (-) Transcript_110896:971-1642(-)